MGVPTTLMRRIKAVKKITGVLRGTVAVGGLEEKLTADQPEGADPPGVRHSFRTLAHHLEGCLARYRASEHALEASRKEARRVRRSRKRAMVPAQQQIVDVRGVVDGIFGGGTCAENFRLPGRTSQKPEELKEQGENLYVCLRDPLGHLPKARVGGVDFESLADDLEPMIKRLSRTIDAVVLAKEDVELRVIDKKAALAELDAAGQSVIQIAQSYAALEGRKLKLKSYRALIRKRPYTKTSPTVA